MKKRKRFFGDDEGATAVEYAVMLALIIVVCIGAITSFGGTASSVWSDNQQKIDTAYSAS